MHTIKKTITLCIFTFGICSSLSAMELRPVNAEEQKKVMYRKKLDRLNQELKEYPENAQEIFREAKEIHQATKNKALEIAKRARILEAKARREMLGEPSEAPVAPPF